MPARSALRSCPALWSPLTTRIAAFSSRLLSEAHAAFVTRTTGLTLMETKDPSGHSHVVVAEIQPRAPANLAGLNTFDEVLAIDGQRTAQIGLTGARRLLSAESGKQTHTLLVQSTIGKPRLVKVPLFDPLQ